jgi:hypothetical protein
MDIKFAARVCPSVRRIAERAGLPGFVEARRGPRQRNLDVMVQEACKEENQHGFLHLHTIQELKHRIYRTNELNMAYAFSVTPLHTACCRFAPEVLRILLEANPDPTLKNSLGETAFERMKKMSRGTERQKQCIQMMQEYLDTQFQKRKREDDEEGQEKKRLRGQQDDARHEHAKEEDA